jgi:hypothetical protein
MAKIKITKMRKSLALESIKKHRKLCGITLKMWNLLFCVF